MAFPSPSDSRSRSRSSSLSSLGSRSPSPPPPETYPSPSSSQDFPALLSFAHVSDDADLPRPAKKRKTAERKPRTTEHLNLLSKAPLERSERYSHELSRAEVDQLGVLLKTLRRKKKIVVLAGAGISVSAGIPDFRSSRGLFSTLRGQHNLKSSGKDLFDASVYKSDEDTARFHEMVRSLSHMVKATKATPFHHLLATLAHEGRLLRLYTQNIDGLDVGLPPLATQIPLPHRAPWPRSIQLHGGLGKMICQKCQHLADFNPALFNGPEPPPCPECVQLDSVRTTIAGKRSHGIGRLRPRILLYNEHNADEETVGKVSEADKKSRPDAIIVVGTSFKIPGFRKLVKDLCGVVRSRRDGVSIWINKADGELPREFEDLWDLIVKAEADEVARHADLGKWDDNETGEWQEIGPDHWTRTDERTGMKRKRPAIEIEIEIVPLTRSIDMVQLAKGVLTPIGSPHCGQVDLTKGGPTSLVLSSTIVPTARKSTSLLETLRAASRKESDRKSKSLDSRPKPKSNGPLKKKQPKGTTKIATLPTSRISNAFKLSKGSSTTITTTTKKTKTKAKKADDTDVPWVNQFPNLGHYTNNNQPTCL